MKLTEVQQKALIESGKEFLRIVGIAVIPILIVQLENGGIQWKPIVIAGSIAVLKALDKMIHYYGKETNNPDLELGLTRF